MTSNRERFTNIENGRNLRRRKKKRHCSRSIFNRIVVFNHHWRLFIESEREQNRRNVKGKQSENEIYHE